MNFTGMKLKIESKINSQNTSEKYIHATNIKTFTIKPKIILIKEKVKGKVDPVPFFN
jgi:hypothetical protein